MQGETTMIAGLGLKNFKAFRELDIELKPITLFLGPNNSGKSSILAALRLLAQTAKKDDFGIPLLFRGGLGDFGTYTDVVYANDESLEITLSISILAPSPKSNSLDFFEQNDLITGDYTFLYDTKNKILDRRIPELKVNNSIAYLTEHDDNNHRLALYKRLDEILKSSLFYLEYVGPIRSIPLRTYQFGGSKPTTIGIVGENAVSILEAVSTKEEDTLDDDVRSWLKRAEIASDLRIEPLTNRHYEVRFQHPETKEYQNIVDVGQGNSQVLPVLVGGFNLYEGEIFIVEEPEIHLHPKAQAELGHFFLTLYERGVQSLVETHSEHLVLRLQQYVASGELPPEDIAVYYVYAENGEKVIKQMNLDRLGIFTDEWPEGFFPERVQEAEALSRLRFKARVDAKKNGSK